MTALKEYQRLEASGLWRPDPQAQRREVIVSLGDATLTISEFSGRALAHWSLAAIVRANKGELPALFHPDGDPGETLELPADETTMIAAIDRLLRAIERRRPRPGKLRILLVAAFAVVIAGAAIFWMPGALLRHTERVVPEVKRAEIGRALLDDITRVAGQPCMTPEARTPLRRLSQRILGEARRDALVVLPGGVQETAHLPGGLVLVNRDLIEDHEDPDIAAGYILAEAVRARSTEPLADLLEYAGLWASLQLLTTGELPEATLQSYAEQLLTGTPETVPNDRLLRAFAAADLRSSPYAYARDMTGETTLSLIEADPRAAQGSATVLSDADWLRLQGICGG
ncbi:hypothetical protein [Salipiger mucosus]|uniref:Peptidase M48 domain-containing protein n=1 Tax=Salipiger mucosus DSM 16094 TaxID=1123237 RepID=S9QIX1_9RHOB|nr:hypothetical protein [Salipiger mucosus]EPX79513.1 hypothetical protein Salmuc_04732 [Salipiger mucosus DSM 16094]